MLIYLARRLALALVTCAAISVLTFVIIRLPPGDFVDAYIANLAVGGSSVSAEQADAMRREYGLDRPVVVQYGLWMGRVLVGDFNEWIRGLTTKVLSEKFESLNMQLHTQRKRSYPGILPLLHLDHIYFELPLHIESAELVRTKLATIASDHLPLVATFSWDGSSQSSADH